MVLHIRPRFTESVSDTHTTYYNDLGQIIPSVTTILKVINKEALIYWANSLGWNKVSVKKELDRTSAIGTLAHNYIEAFVTDNIGEMMSIETEINALNENDKKETRNCISSFILFWQHHKNEFEIIECEKPLHTDSYGGTCDMIAKHNGELCILDLKTSKEFHFTMMLQLSAYWKAYKKMFNEEPKRVAIIKMDKHNGEEAKILWNTDLPCSKLSFYYQVFRHALDLYRDTQSLESTWKSVNKKERKRLVKW